MNHYVGMDLHSNNTVMVIIDDDEKWAFKRKFKNNLKEIVQALTPFRASLSGVVVEATYNWYWLVDGVQKAGYKVHLAHPAKLEGRKGKKHTNDYDSAYYLAHLLRMKNLPEGYIYPAETRGQRDLLRKRSILVRKRTDFILGLINFANRNTGYSISVNELDDYVEHILKDEPHDELLYLSGRSSLECVRFLSTQITRLEKVVLMMTQSTPYYKILLTVPGIGKILALTITLETGDIRRFKTSGDYVSYCRGVGCKQISNEKTKGQKNRKSGNRYLAWAFVEAANFSKRSCPGAKEFYNRKLKESKKSVLAIKALASKLARACYYMMRDNAAFEPKRLFNHPDQNPRSTNTKGCGNKPQLGTGRQPIV